MIKTRTMIQRSMGLPLRCDCCRSGERRSRPVGYGRCAGRRPRACYESPKTALRRGFEPGRSGAVTKVPRERSRAEPDDRIRDRGAQREAVNREAYGERDDEDQRDEDPERRGECPQCGALRLLGEPSHLVPVTPQRRQAAEGALEVAPVVRAKRKLDALRQLLGREPAVHELLPEGRGRAITLVVADERHAPIVDRAPRERETPALAFSGPTACWTRR